MDVYANQSQLIYTTYYLGFLHTLLALALALVKLVVKNRSEFICFVNDDRKLPRWHVAFRQRAVPFGVNIEWEKFSIKQFGTTQDNNNNSVSNAKI